MPVRGLILAVEKYPQITGFGQELPGTAGAGAAFRQWLLDVKKADAANILFCTDDAAAEGRTAGTSVDAMIQAISSLVQQGKDRTSELYVFFSGHGILFDEDERKRAADVLLAGDFAAPQDSGRCVLRLDELQTKLQVVMGPGNHYYFIDACRNVLDASEIDVTGMGKAYGRSVLGDPTLYTLFSTSRGEVAYLKSHFSEHLLAGLRGSGRAKRWDPDGGDEMEVAYDSLKRYVQEKLAGPQVPDGEMKGSGDGVILEIRPAPRYECTIEVNDAGPGDEFTLTVFNSRGQQVGGERKFTGPRFVFQEPPDNYRLQILQQGMPLKPSELAVDLWDASKAQFALAPPPGGGSFPVVIGGDFNFGLEVEGGGSVAPVIVGAVTGAESKPARLKVMGVGPAALWVENPLTGWNRKYHRGFSRELPVGQYVIRKSTRDGITLRKQEVLLEPGKTVIVDLGTRSPSPVREAILARLPHYAYTKKTVEFSESVGRLMDDDLALWLAILGASRIVVDPGENVKLRDLPLASFEDMPPGAAAVYVLAGWDSGDSLQVATTGPDARWVQATEVVEGAPGLLHTRIEAASGPFLLSLGKGDKAAVTLVSHALPNRATLVVATVGKDSSLRVQQYLLPFHHLLGSLDPEVRKHLHTNPLRMVKLLTLAQRQFARNRDVASTMDELEWKELLRGKWTDPIMAVLAAYELIRRGRLEHLSEVVGNLRLYFPGLPDTEALAKLSGQPATGLASAPLILDGLFAFDDYEELLPLPEGKLDYNGPWTAWRGAVER
jgi:Caspase domain